jgi:hypothetical protein
LVRIKVINQPVERVQTEVLALGVFEDVRPLSGPAEEVDWIFGGVLSRLILEGKIRGGTGESVLLAARSKLPAEKVLVVGLGRRDQFNLSSMMIALRSTLEQIRKLNARRGVMEFFGILDCPIDIRQAVEGMLTLLRGEPAAEALDLTLLVSNSNKAHQAEQYLLAASVTV